jgi:diguanylate cyclase (GGDEF)-like protein/PAS domain S-box-containing protein
MDLKSKEQLNMFKQMLENMYEGVYFVDKERKITLWNNSAVRITGYTAQEVINSHCYDNILNHVNDDGVMMCLNGCPLHASITDGQIREGGFYLMHKNGHRVSVAVKVMPLYKEGEIIGGIEVFIDDSHLAESNKEINRLKSFALFDELTELPNRRYINSFLDSRIKEFYELKIKFGLVMMDIDNFKKVNDTYGHDVGDLVLKNVAKTLISSYRQSDLVGRWGGEEFLAVLTGIDENSIKKTTEKVRSLVENSVTKYSKGSINVTISAGVSLFNENDTLEKALKRVDDAMYKSKLGGRNRVTYI